MFTGIVQGKATVSALLDKEGLRQLTLHMPDPLENLREGASIAVNGTCLTVIAFKQQAVTFDIIAETLKLTNLGELQVGSEVNVERSLRFGDEIGGHLLSGHIHGTVTVLERFQTTNNLTLTLKAPAELQRFLLPKGFVALDGASLTIGEYVKDGVFQVHLIPETLALTTLVDKEPGARINLEIDSQTQAIVTTVERVLAQQQAVNSAHLRE